jgi:adenylate kinase
MLASEMGATHISTGELVRAAIHDCTPLGRMLQRFNDRGELVPDQLMLDLVMPRISAASTWILDGFPRDLPQAQALDDALGTLGLCLDRAIVLELPDAALVDRLQNRRLSMATGTTYNLLSDPPPAGDPGPFVQRADDHPDEIRRRLEIYHAKTEPLRAYYARRGNLCVLGADGSVQAVHAQLVAALAC